ncbi:hypothetical protein ACFPZ0_00890 [Streptomonospora nanhaiensis]|uniref:hypothetical protein n=1 Tax=Streptomonospora nanhaiensis TaxID=1323731 RepID=UPI001C3924CD|nr:hypothetical protein [Streptomonospora nanhaiensis]MBV2366374.1 hypothetical protein [Streptomonospora nanhaiensis]MBX9388974.1 hypothetical protein [Streptomonospora nanhaiensis]
MAEHTTPHTQAGPGGVAAPARGWPRWAPRAAVGWSLGYGAIGAACAAIDGAFPYAGMVGAPVAPLATQFGTGPAWAAILLAGFPAAALGAVLLRRSPAGRRPLIAAGALVSALLLLAMTDVNLLTALGYLPYGLVGLVSGAPVGEAFRAAVLNWPFLHQLLCLAGGFLWLMATLSYARTSRGACGSCGRDSGAEGWAAPGAAARWGVFAVAVAAAVPLLYAFTRVAWWLGIPLGITEEFLRAGQEEGMWTSGLFLAGFAVVGAVLTLGLVQRWGEVFPRWMVGLAGRRVPIALAVAPASVVSVLVLVGGFAMWSGYAELVGQGVSGDAEAAGLMAVLPGLLFPVWGVALGAATLAYYLRRRGTCAVCGNGAPAAAG